MHRLTNNSVSVFLKGLILTVCSLSFWPYLRQAGEKGYSSGDYSHVFVIPLIALVVYLRSPKSEPLPPRCGVAGVLLACGLVLRTVGEIWSLPLAAEAGFPLLFIGMIELLFGHGEARRITFPALFLLFGFGFVTDIMLKLFVNYLVLVSSGAAYDAATTFAPHLGPFVLMKNTIMVPPLVRFDVVEECSGIRGLLALFVIGSLVAYTKKLAWRSVLRFMTLIAVASIAMNVVRIGLTIISSLMLRGRLSHHFLHEFWNYAIFGILILLTPLMARWVERVRFRISLVGTLAVLMILAHAVQWHVRATEGNAKLVVRQLPYQKPQATLMVDQQGVPRAFLPYVSPEQNGQRRWRWVLTSGFVHSNISHLAVNVLLLVILGHGLRRDLKTRWVVSSLLTGQLAGVLAAWWSWTPTVEAPDVIFTGASCAVSGLFGLYLAAHLLARHKWVQAPAFFILYAAGLRLTAGHLGRAYHFSFASHLAGLAAGMATAFVWVFLQGQVGKPDRGRISFLTVLR